MELFDRIVSETVSSEIEPVAFKFTGIYDCYSAKPLAYRTETELFSSLYGKITDFSEKIDASETGRNLTLYAIRKAIRYLKKFKAAERKIEWISVTGTTAFLFDEDLYGTLKALFDKENFSETDKICIEFTKNIFTLDRQKVLKGLADLKVIGIKTVISGFAADGFPVSALLDVSVDAVILSPEITALALDRNKPDVLSSLVRFVKSMNANVIAEGAATDDEIRELNKMECFGFIPSKDYSGRFTFKAEKRDFASALEDKENE